MSEELKLDWIEQGLPEFEDDKDFEKLVSDYHKERKAAEKTSFDYFRLGLEKFIQEWEEWK